MRVKICGLTNVEDALAATEAGADLLGFVFYPPSPRYVTMEQAGEIIAALRRSEGGTVGEQPFRTVGVFVDEELGWVQEAIQQCDLDYAQLHGKEPPEYVAALGGRAIKALRVRSAADVERLAAYQSADWGSPPAAYLLDAYHPTKPGGTGEAWEWGLAMAAKRYGPIIVAGGLTPDNVAEVVRRVQPYGVDVSSGVESAPGRKDTDKVQRFVAAAKGFPHPRLALGARSSDFRRFSPLMDDRNRHYGQKRLCPDSVARRGNKDRWSDE